MDLPGFAVSVGPNWMDSLKTYQCPGRRGSNPSYAHGSASAPLAGRFTSSFILP
jgi:hypothetical protein